MSAGHDEALARLLAYGRNLVARDRENAMRQWRENVERVLSECPDGTRWKVVQHTIQPKPRIVKSKVTDQWVAHSPAYPFQALAGSPVAAYVSWNNALRAHLAVQGVKNF